MSAITAIGLANPPFKQRQSELAELAAATLNLNPQEKRLLKYIYKGTGIEFRHSVLPDYCSLPGDFTFYPNDADATFPSTAQRMQIYKETALSLALQAIENCFSQLKNFNKLSITHLITVSCTGMYAPGLDIEITQKLALTSTMKRTAINFMGCYGAFNALKVANDICKADKNAKVLIVCIELCTIHFQKNKDLDYLVSNAIFADGAAAVLVEASIQQTPQLKIESFHCDLLPQTQQEMAWHIDNYGFDIVLSSYIPNLIENGIVHFTHEFFSKYNLSPAEIDFYAIHPGGLKILKACEKALNIKPQQNQHAYSVLKNFGNMSSPTVLFVLKELWQHLDETDHDKTIFSCAFGPGLTLESMLLRASYV